MYKNTLINEFSWIHLLFFASRENLNLPVDKVFAQPVDLTHSSLGKVISYTSVTSSPTVTEGVKPVLPYKVVLYYLW